MKNYEKAVDTLLQYVLKKARAGEDQEAQDVLNQWDSYRTGRSLEDVTFLNQCVRDGTFWTTHRG